VIDISELSTQKKSRLLARAMGWRAWLNEESFHAELNGQWWILSETGRRIHGVWNDHKIDPLDEARAFRNLCPDLYKEANMALAWRVLNWAEDQTGNFRRAWLNFLPESLFEMDAQGAQETWLDAVLARAVEACLIEPEIPAE
jgi:hypothetical protein